MAFNISSITGNIPPMSGIGQMPQISGAGGKLMAAGTKEYSDYREKYFDFEFPEAKAEIEDTVLGVKSKFGFAVNNINIELTAGYEASVAHFRIYNVYNIKEGKYSYKKIENQLQLAAKITLWLGYSGRLTEVFSGFIAGYNFIFQQDDVPYIEVSAIDVKGAMMPDAQSRSLKGKSYCACVNELLSNPRYSKYIEGQKIEQTPDNLNGTANSKDKTIEMVDESDYEFILKSAKKFGYEFFVSQGIVYFRKPKSQTAVMAKLAFGKGIIYIDAGYSIMGLVKTIEARSADAGKGTLISSKVKINKKYGSKSFAKELLKNSVKVYVDATIRSSDDAKHRAAALEEDISYSFGSLNCDCVGIPDLIPGRFIELEGMGEGISNRFYVTEVKHTFDTQSGYMTKIIGKTDSIDANSPMGEVGSLSV